MCFICIIIIIAIGTKSILERIIKLLWIFYWSTNSLGNLILHLASTNWLHISKMAFHEDSRVADWGNRKLMNLNLRCNIYMYTYIICLKWNTNCFEVPGQFFSFYGGISVIMWESQITQVASLSPHFTLSP